MRFLRTQRLLAKKDFDEVFKVGARFKAQHFSLVVKPNQLPYSRLGLVVAKKQIASAVMRNTAKRIIRESFRCYQSNLPPVDIVVIVYRSFSQCERTELPTHLELQWQRLIKRYGKR